MGIPAPVRAWGMVAGEPPVEQGSHVCWLFDADASFREAAVQFLAEGDRRGERLLFVADRPTVDDLCAEVADLGDVSRRIDDGSLSAVPLRSLYAPDGSFDSGQQLERYREMAVAAQRDGYRGLRLVADATAMVASTPARRLFMDHELAVDALVAELSFSALCAYDTSVLGAAGAELCIVHPQRHVPSRDDPGFSLFQDGQGVLRLAGEVDVRSRAFFSQALSSAAAVAGDEIVLDLGDLGFIDVAGLTQLWRWAAGLRAEDKALRLDRVPAIVTRCCCHLGFDDLLAAATSETAGP